MTEQTPGSPVVILEPMSSSEFDSWSEHSVESFAADIARASGRPLEAARLRAAAQWEELLPDGFETEGMWFYTLLNRPGEAVGVLWLGPHPAKPNAGYVYEIEIAESARRRGYARQAMLAAEQVVIAAGMTELGLSVFGFNEGAQRLYESLGYRVTATQMAKSLPGAP